MSHKLTWSDYFEILKADSELEIGFYTKQTEKERKEKAEYGSQLFERLSKDLTTAYGKGFSRSNLFQMRLLYIKFPIVQTLSVQLTWSHYLEILKADTELEIGFYAKQTEKERWSVLPCM